MLHYINYVPSLHYSLLLIYKVMVGKEGDSGLMQSCGDGESLRLNDILLYFLFSSLSFLNIFSFIILPLHSYFWARFSVI